MTRSAKRSPAWRLRLSIHRDFGILKGFVVKKSHISCMDKDVQWHLLVEVYPVTQTENPVHFENLSMRKHDDLTSVDRTKEGVRWARKVLHRLCQFMLQMHAKMTIQSCVKTYLLSSENHSQNVPLPTQRKREKWWGLGRLAWAKLCLSLPYRHGMSLGVRAGQPMSQGNPWARAKSGWITIRNLLCFELEQIQDHIYYTFRGHLYSNCGVKFVVATLG